MNEQALTHELAEAIFAQLIHPTTTALSLSMPRPPSLTTLTFDFWKDLLGGDLTPWNVGGGVGWNRKA